MSEVEKMRRYIERTKMKDHRNFPYSMTYGEINELGRKMKQNDDAMLAAIVMIFEYGRAKGYRAAKAEVRA